MNKEEVMRAVESGEMSVENVVDALFLEKRRSESVYLLVNKLERLSSSLESSLRESEARYFERMAFEKGVIEHILPNLKDLKWKNIVDYIEAHIREHKEDGKGRHAYCEISEIGDVPLPGFRWNE